MWRHHQRTSAGSGILVPGAAALVFASVLAQLSIWPAYMLERHAIRHEMKDRILAGLPEEALTVFRLTDEELAEVDFEDGGQELCSGGMMFDIVRRFQDEQGYHVIQAARDDKETKLMAGLDVLVNRRLAADEQGQSERARIISAWAVYFEPIDALRPPVPPVKEVAFAMLSSTDGRRVPAIDPGPPRQG